MTQPVTVIERLRKIASMPGVRPSLRGLLTEAADDLESYEQSFDLRWGADMRAIKRWQEANPGNDLTWPDHADLVVWLMDEKISSRKGVVP